MTRHLSPFHILVAASIGSCATLPSALGVDCTFPVTAGVGDTCDLVAATWGITLSHFEALNPGVVCPRLVAGQQYCVIGSVTSTSAAGSVSTSSLPSTTLTTVTTSTSTTPTSPYEPTQEGIASNCNKFHFVNVDDTCEEIAAKYGISVADFYSWNPAVGEDCRSMWAFYWVCVGVPGATPTSASPTPTQSGPQPQMPGIIANCRRYYLVQPGDSCYTIQQTKGITLEDLRAWNKELDAGCTNLWSGYWICTGV